MAWVMVLGLVGVAALVLIVVLVLVTLLERDREASRVAAEMEINRAERSLHDLAGASFRTMLEEARAVSRSRSS